MYNISTNILHRLISSGNRLKMNLLFYWCMGLVLYRVDNIQYDLVL